MRRGLCPQSQLTLGAAQTSWPPLDGLDSWRVAPGLWNRAVSSVLGCHSPAKHPTGARNMAQQALANGSRAEMK